jgi:hypothetical protein
LLLASQMMMALHLSVADLVKCLLMKIITWLLFWTMSSAFPDSTFQKNDAFLPWGVKRERSCQLGPNRYAVYLAEW